jgi:hypothetical protein
VAGANKFSTSQKFDIFDYFSKFRIYNCIIVSQELYIIDKEYSRPINVNYVDTGMQLRAYTWFPYQRSGRCTDVDDITLLDSWVISAQGHFIKNTDLFPRKVSKTLNRCPMKEVVRKSFSHLTTMYIPHMSSNVSDVTEVVGMEAKVLFIVLKQMNMTFVHVPTPEGFET